MDKKNKTPTVSSRDVRRRLGGLSLDALEDAVAAGLLIRLPDQRFDAESVAYAEACGEDWHKSLHDERRLNATDAAKRLGVPVARFRSAVKAGQIEPVASAPWKYGTIWFYRGADIDALAGWLTLDAAERHVSAVSRRPEAARKAAETRRRNAEVAKAARQAILDATPGDDAGPVVVAIYVTAMFTGLGFRRGPLGDLSQIGQVKDLAQEFANARFSNTEKTNMYLDWRDRGLAARNEMVRARDLNYSMGLAPGTLPHLYGWTTRPEAELWIKENPDKIEQAWAQARDRQLVEAANRVIEAERRRAHSELAILEARAFLAAHVPSDDAHPTVRLKFAVSVITALGGSVEGVAADREFERNEVTFQIQEMFRRLPKQVRREEMALLQSLAQDAKKSLAVLNCPRRYRAQRLDALASLGLLHYGHWVVGSEVKVILKDQPELVAKWQQQDMAEAQRVAARNARRQNKNPSRKERWAKALNISVDLVPDSLGNPTERAIRNIQKYPPRWLKAIRNAQG
ncbi:hypothetical protein [Ferrimicrobium acidiphilum]|uniref:hypothetical protein n=1 Tax=Ferrimicrobium acidiphilum TaxID=121039 RepID=UPI0023F2F08E|nr:hypothetical protein [Ferrimicrobium acidiphilum]